MTCENCDCIQEEDWVESKLNTNVFGIVVGSTGAHVDVQLSPSLFIQRFHIGTLRRMDFSDSYTPPAAEQEPADNVIPVDFTQPRKSATLH
jgi:hypothetical protein